MISAIGFNSVAVRGKNKINRIASTCFYCRKPFRDIDAGGVIFVSGKLVVPTYSSMTFIVEYLTNPMNKFIPLIFKFIVTLRHFVIK